MLVCAPLCAPPLAFSAELEEIVVTARAVEESIRDIPVSITALSEERLDHFALETFDDLEALTPQLRIARTNNGAGASISLRGIGSPSTSIGVEQSVSVILDGAYQPQGRAISEGLFDSSQVAVLKGPQALYFGKNATAGVISVQTNNPGEETEVRLRVNNEFKTDDTTYEGIISVPVNEKFGVRLALQYADQEEGFIRNNATGPDVYATFDAATGVVNLFDNPLAEPFLPQEELFFSRLTFAGDLTDTLSYNIKTSYTDNQRAYGSVSELFDCSTLNGTAHTSQLAAVQPEGRQTPLFEPLPLAAVDCNFDGELGVNPIPPAVAATNDLLNQFGNGQARDEFESLIVTGNFDWALESADVHLNLSYQDQTARWAGDQDGGAVTSIFASERNTLENFSAEGRVSTRLNSQVNFTVGGYYQNWDRGFRQNVIFAFLPAGPGPFADCALGAAGACGPQNSAAADPNDEFIAYDKDSVTDGETFSIYSELQWDIADNWTLTAGARYLRETKDSTFIQPYVNPFVTGLFIQFDPADPLTQAAADQTFKNLIPEATLSWAATEELTFYAAYKEGYKTGGFSNSAILSNLSPPIVTGDEILFSDFVFDPEQNRGGELGLKASLYDNSVRASFDLFYYKFRDLQVDFFNSQQFAFVTENAGGSETYGAELQVDWATPVDGLVLSGSIAYLESTFTDFEAFCFVGQTPAQGCGPLQPGQTETDLRQNLSGNTRPQAPTWSGFLSANFERPFGDRFFYGISGNWQFRSSTALAATDPFAREGAFSTFDANVRIGTTDGAWQLAFIGRNLTNESAITNSNNVPGTGGNTGTAEGFRGDLLGGAIRPVQLELELRYAFVR